MIAIARGAPPARLLKWLWLLPVVALLATACSSQESAPEPTAEPNPTTTSTAPSTPPSLSREEAAADAALVVYEDFADVLEQAYIDPSQDWTDELSAVSADPLRANRLRKVTALRDNRIVYQGTWLTEPSVDQVEFAPVPMVTIWTCSDVTGWTAIDTDTGEIFTDPEQPLRYPLVYQVTQAEDGRWLVSDSTPYLDQTC